jgi:hypothetical protein
MSVTGSQGAVRIGRQDVCWQSFLRALAMQLDSVAGAAARDTLLRGAGRQMATLRPVPAVLSMDALEAEMNAVLDELGWGRCSLALQESERRVAITHIGLPTIGSAGEPPRTWLVAAVEGLYEGWFLQQAESDPTFVARRHDVEQPERIVLRYGRDRSAMDRA